MDGTKALYLLAMHYERDVDGVIAALSHVLKNPASHNLRPGEDLLSRILRYTSVRDQLATMGHQIVDAEFLRDSIMPLIVNSKQ
jgi:hypothetical protein